jgi:hypothetical protein
MWLDSASGGGDGASGHGATMTRARDLTQFGASGHLVGMSDRSLTLCGSFSNVGDQRSMLNLGDTWMSSVVFDRRVRSPHADRQSWGQRLYFVRVSI